MSIVIDTPEGIEFFRFQQVYRGIKLQRDTGLTHSRGSLIKLAQQIYGIKGRTAKKACRELEDIFFEAMGEYPIGSGR